MKAKVLVIDDEPAMREIIGEVISLDKYDVSFAEDGEQGLEMYRTDKPDLVITDLHMPNKDGASLVQELKEEFPKARIMVLSGSQNVDMFARVVHMNANRIMTKPFTIDELLDAIAELIDEKAHDNTHYQHHHYPTVS